MLEKETIRIMFLLSATLLIILLAIVLKEYLKLYASATAIKDIGDYAYYRIGMNYKNFTKDLEKNTVELGWKQFEAFYNIAPDKYKLLNGKLYYENQRIIFDERDYSKNFVPWIKAKLSEKYQMEV